MCVGVKVLNGRNVSSKSLSVDERQRHFHKQISDLKLFFTYQRKRHFAMPQPATVMTIIIVQLASAAGNILFLFHSFNYMHLIIKKFY